jgi:predicted RNA-binding Zn-ribbon protein involved in translation (DUF1610 family)
MDPERMKWLEDVRKRLAPGSKADTVADVAKAFWQSGFDVVDPQVILADARALLDFADVLLEQLAMQEQKRSESSEAMAESLRPYGADYTWPCNACGETRPDIFISVAHRKVRWLAPRGTGVVQINARYCNDRPDCLRRIPEWLDGLAAPMLNNGHYRPANMDKPPLRVHHLYLQPLEGLMLEPVEGRYKVLCPLCGGALLVYRNQQTAVLSPRDRCIRCGQLYIYLDEKIGGEPVEPLTPAPPCSD